MPGEAWHTGVASGETETQSVLQAQNKKARHKVGL
jgi:hypothetical protein